MSDPTELKDPPRSPNGQFGEGNGPATAPRGRRGGVPIRPVPDSADPDGQKKDDEAKNRVADDGGDGEKKKMAAPAVPVRVFLNAAASPALTTSGATPMIASHTGRVTLGR